MLQRFGRIIACFALVGSFSTRSNASSGASSGGSAQAGLLASSRSHSPSSTSGTNSLNTASVTPSTITPAMASAPNSNSDGQSVNGVMGFQYWKQLQIDEAKQVLERVQASSPTLNGSAPANESNKSPKLIRMDQRLKQSQLNLEIAQELTVNDYFLIYLSQFKGKDSLIEAAKRLSPDEVAELLMSYQRYLSRADQVDAPASGLLTGFGSSPARSTAPTGRQTPRPKL